MEKIIAVICSILSVSLATAGMNRPAGLQNNQPIRVLILSGSNNHDWEKTTPFLNQILTDSGLFLVEVTTKPDTLKSVDLTGIDVVVSNWNSWPDNDLRWPESAEKTLLGFIKKGGGFVTFHSSTSALYEWPEFKEISTAAWVMDSTWHGKRSAVRVMIENKHHPITKGMTGFHIFDELWVNAEKNKRFERLGSATNDETSGKGIGSQPAIMVAEYGKGKIFHTILGHDIRAMRNTGFQALILRGAEWAATGKVTQTFPQELLESRKTVHKFSWQRTDSTFALLNGKNLLWQYNFNTIHGRPFFHPVYVGKNNITCVSPEDHPWHLGQWFCWKYINKVNYWEYHKGSLVSDGTTKIAGIETQTNPDNSAEIKLQIAYHPEGGESVLSEFRTVKVSPPLENGNISMDYTMVFEALADTVVLDRTPIEGQPNGKSWGGYAGLSIRFNQDFMDSHFIAGQPGDETINGTSGDWLYMGFTGIDGQKTGSQIMVAPNSKREGSAWYSVNTESAPFYFFTPAYLYFKPLILKKGEKIRLNYRITHWKNEPGFEQLGSEHQRYLKTIIPEL